MANKRYEIVCPNCDEPFRVKSSDVEFIYDGEVLGVCPQCNHAVKAHLTSRAVDFANCPECGVPYSKHETGCAYCVSRKSQSH